MNKTYAVSDLHGMYNLWNQIKNYCDETDTIYFLGDAADRGPDGLNIVEELLKDKRVIYLKGNHEDMLTICVKEYLEGITYNLPWWFENGGNTTWKALELYSDDAKKHLMNKLDSLPRSMWYNSPNGHKIFLTHAGTQLDLSEDELYKYFGIKDAYLWDRKHIGFKRPVGAAYENVFQVHGHTPVISSKFYGHNPEIKVETIFYGEHKYNIDMGAFATGKTALIDLDTFETKYFYDEISMKESIYE